MGIGRTTTEAGGHRITAVRVHQTSDHVDRVQFRFDSDVFHGTATSRSGKPTAIVALDLDEDEDITSVKLTFANEMMWAKSLTFTTSKGRVVDSGDAIQQLSAGFVSRYNQPSVTMANNGAPLTGFVDELCIEEDPRMGSCLTQKITFKF